MDGSKPVITYCRIGERSSHSWFALSKLLGYETRNYDGSWTEYGNNVGSPISNRPARSGARPDARRPDGGRRRAGGRLVVSSWLSGLPEVGRALSLSALLGAAFGVVLQRSRFCFYCIARDFIQRREASGLYAVLIALAAGTLGYHAVFGAFLPVPGADRLLRARISGR